MSGALSLPSPSAIEAPARAAGRGRLAERFLASLFLTALLVNVPAFLCMGLDADANQWDLCARAVMQGDVLYRDALENNLPGMLWLHVAVRALLGWSSGVLRLVDLAIVLALIGL